MDSNKLLGEYISVKLTDWATMNFIKGKGLRKLDVEFLQHTLSNFDGELR